MQRENPKSVVVSAEIDIHQAIAAVVEFSKKYPAGQLSVSQVLALDSAAATMHRRIHEHTEETQGTDYE